jgi:hypothetical protein
MMGAKTGRASLSGGGSEFGTSLPLAAYQAAPLLDLPLRRGMVGAIGGLGMKMQRRSRRVRESKCRALQRGRRRGIWGGWRGRVLRNEGGRILPSSAVGAPYLGRGSDR